MGQITLEFKTFLKILTLIFFINATMNSWVFAAQFERAVQVLDINEHVSDDDDTAYYYFDVFVLSDGSLLASIWDGASSSPHKIKLVMVEQDRANTIATFSSYLEYPNVLPYELYRINNDEFLFKLNVRDQPETEVEYYLIRKTGVTKLFTDNEIQDVASLHVWGYNFTSDNVAGYGDSMPKSDEDIRPMLLGEVIESEIQISHLSSEGDITPVVSILPRRYYEPNDIDPIVIFKLDNGFVFQISAKSDISGSKDNREYYYISYDGQTVSQLYNYSQCRFSAGRYTGESVLCITDEFNFTIYFPEYDYFSISERRLDPEQVDILKNDANRMPRIDLIKFNPLSKGFNLGINTGYFLEYRYYDMVTQERYDWSKELKNDPKDYYYDEIDIAYFERIMYFTSRYFNPDNNKFYAEMWVTDGSGEETPLQLKIRSPDENLIYSDMYRLFSQPDGLYFTLDKLDITSNQTMHTIQFFDHSDLYTIVDQSDRPPNERQFYRYFPAKNGIYFWNDSERILYYMDKEHKVLTADIESEIYQEDETAEQENSETTQNNNGSGGGGGSFSLSTWFLLMSLLLISRNKQLHSRVVRRRHPFPSS